MTTFPIIALSDGEVADPAWFIDITDSVNDHEERIDTLESQVNTASASNSDPTSRTTSSTSFTSTLSPANICGTAFVAPTSGTVLIALRTQMQNSGNNYTGASFEIREGSTVGSGTVLLAADDARAMSTTSTFGEGQGITDYVSGLTPGATYNASILHRVTVGSMTTLRRSISVIPLIA